MINVFDLFNLYFAFYNVLSFFPIFKEYPKVKGVLNTVPLIRLLKKTSVKARRSLANERVVKKLIEQYRYN